MKIIIHNTAFSFNEGCRLLKLQHKECPYPEISDFWDDIIPMSFAEIATMPNIEERRVGILCMGLERLASEIEPTLIDSQTINKTTSWVLPSGDIKVLEFNDTYELYKVDGKHFSKGLQSYQTVEDCYYVKCKDTSTDRYYFIWVDLRGVWNTNNQNNTRSYIWGRDVDIKITALQAIAWTMQTNVNMGNIEKIIRQGDCILIKPYDANGIGSVRHLTEDEYRTLLVAES
jgi:hypothetical protein